MDCTPGTLLTAAKCFSCLTPKQLDMVMTYVMAVAAGGSTDPIVLLGQAKCFACLNDKQIEMVKVYLLCQLAG